MVYQVLSILSIIQGVFLAVVLFHKYKESKTSLYLSLIIMFNVYLSVCILLFYTEVLSANEVYYFIEFQQLANAPLIFLYIKTLSYANFVFHKKLLLHFVPASVSFLFLILYIFIDIPFITSHFKTLFIPAVIMLGYSLRSMYILLVNWHNFHDWALSISRRVFYYTHIIMVFHLIAIKSLLIGFTLYYGLSDMIPYLELFFIAVISVVAFIVYFFGYFIMLNPVIFTDKIRYNSNDESNEENFDSEELNSKLVSAMEKEKPYLDPSLTLFSLGHIVKSRSIKELSTTIKRHHKCSYYELINQYRINEFLSLINKKQHNRSTILELAFAAGFNSKAIVLMIG